MTTDDGKPADGGNPEDKKGDAPSYADWLKAQPEDVQKRINENEAALKSAHERQKEDNRTLREEIKAIRESKTLDAQEQAKQIEEKLHESEKRVAFFESLPAEYHSNAKAAWTLASANGCLKRDGSLDIEKFKTQFGELFEPKKRASANAGDGAGNPPTGQNSPMNQALRLAAGYGG
jgi:hypothetical protein